MEAALASVALAGNILQFIGVARSIISRGAELKRSHDGKLKEHRDILSIIADLDKWLSELDVECDDTLRPIVEACKDIATRLKDALNRASRGNRVWSHYKEAIASVWNGKQIKEAEQQLSRLLDSINHHLQATIKRDIGALLERVQRVEHRLEESQIELHKFAETHTHSVNTLQECIEQSTSSIISKCEHSQVLPEELHVMLCELQGLCQQLLVKKNDITRDQGQVPAKAVDRRTFIQSFAFWGMDDRADSIPQAHMRTYEWIIMDSDYCSNDKAIATYHQERQKLHSYLLDVFSELGLRDTTKKYPFHLQVGDQNPTAHLQRWLESGKGIFWIWGKPGCGKSTLMKAMMQNRKLKSRLKSLLNPRTLLASFYFFRPGMNLQKNQIGFLQAVLFQVFQQRQGLIDNIFSTYEQEEAIARYQNLRGSDEPVWTLNGLKRAFQKLVSVDNVELYLHVDGIDEIDCEPIEMARLLCELANYPNVKILTAGRYYGEFEKMFPQDQALNLHELTEMDILRFAVDNLRQPTILKLLKRPDQFVDIIKEIIGSAQGVFQWVQIVVDSLIEGSCHCEDFERLFERLQEYPKDLDDLYQFLYSHIEKRYLADTAFWLLTVLYATQTSAPGSRSKQGSKRCSKPGSWRLQTYDIWTAEQILAMNDDVFEDLIQMSHKDRVRKARETQLRMQSQGRHFFDFGPRSQTLKHVTFAHRTVLDFLTRRNRTIAHQLEENLLPDIVPAFAWTVLKTWCMVRKFEGQHKWCIDGKLTIPTAVANITELGLEKACNAWPRLKKLLLMRPTFDMYGSGTRKILSPEFTGWRIETELDLMHRLERMPYFPLFLSILSRGDIRHSRELDNILQDTTVRRLSEAQRELLLLLRLWSRKTDILFPEMGRLSGYLSHFFPEGLPRQSLCLSRLLEWISIFGDKFFTHDLYNKNTHFLGGYYAVCNVVKAVNELVSRGADSNSVCKSVTRDTDKSHISILTLLLRMESHAVNSLSNEVLGQVPTTPQISHRGGALTDYRMQQMLLKNQNKKRILMTHPEETRVTGIDPMRHASLDLETYRTLLTRLRGCLNEAIQTVKANGGKEIAIASPTECGIGIEWPTLLDYLADDSYL